MPLAALWAYVLTRLRRRCAATTASLCSTPCSGRRAARDDAADRVPDNGPVGSRAGAIRITAGVLAWSACVASVLDVSPLGTPFIQASRVSATAGHRPTRAVLRRCALPQSRVLGIAVVALLVLQGLHSGACGSRPRRHAWPVPARGLGLGRHRGRRRCRSPATPGSHGSPPTSDGINAFEQAIESTSSVVMWYSDWAHPAPLRSSSTPSRPAAASPRSPGSHGIPATPVRDQPRYRLREHHRRSLRPVHPELGTDDRRVRTARPPALRTGDERPLVSMVGSVNGNHPHEFVHAWRHVHDLFARPVRRTCNGSGARLRSRCTRQPVPGRCAYVDLVSLSIFNGGTRASVPRLGAFAARSRPLSEGRAARSRPTSRSRSARSAAPSTGGDKAAWIRQMFATLRRSAITSLIWSTSRRCSDWRVESSRGQPRHSPTARRRTPVSMSCADESMGPGTSDGVLTLGMSKSDSVWTILSSARGLPRRRLASSWVLA